MTMKGFVLPLPLLSPKYRDVAGTTEGMMPMSAPIKSTARVSRLVAPLARLRLVSRGVRPTEGGN